MAEDIRQGIGTGTPAATESQDKPIWNMPVLFVAMVSIAGAEWLIRRRSGFA